MHIKWTSVIYLSLSSEQKCRNLNNFCTFATMLKILILKHLNSQIALNKSMSIKINLHWKNKNQLQSTCQAMSQQKLTFPWLLAFIIQHAVKLFWLNIDPKLCLHILACKCYTTCLWQFWVQWFEEIYHQLLPVSFRQIIAVNSFLNSASLLLNPLVQKFGGKLLVKLHWSKPENKYIWN